MKRLFLTIMAVPLVCTPVLIVASVEPVERAVLIVSLAGMIGAFVGIETESEKMLHAAHRAFTGVMAVSVFAMTSRFACGLIVYLLLCREVTSFATDQCLFEPGKLGASRGNMTHMLSAAAILLLLPRALTA